MEFIDAFEGSPLCSDRLVPQIGPNHQVTMPPLKQSARIASLEYINRDQWYACGLPVPIMYIAAPPFPRKWRSSADQDKSVSLASTSNSRTNVLLQLAQQQQQKIPPCAEVVASKDANSCASSTKETCQVWKKEESSTLLLVDAFQASQSERKPEVIMVDDVPGVSAQSELKSSITSLQGSITIKKKKKRRSCWQTLKRKGTNKKVRTERGRKDKRWSGSLHSEVGEASALGGLAGMVGESCRILPGGQPDSWSEDEVAAFTLALYLFDKDFCAIKRFLETKKMKDILQYYYGKFYGTPAFCRWAGSKNSRNRKCVHGPRILQGWRQDELLRRLHPHFPDTSKDGIPKAVKSFNERELAVEGLASELKAAVGLDVLVRCVAIGVPKRDLTAVHGDLAKHGHHGASGGRVDSTAAAAAAAGKACSSLSKEEMLEWLTGDLRISKTRAHDLFWEAVWPRLLAHGWQSTTECEIPGLPGSKSPLMFLRPGVSKIGKGSSERGIHYYDSVSEVLKAVTDDPGLLDGSELSGDTMEGSDNQEDEDVEGWSDDMFETLDMHRLRGRSRAGKTEAGSKNEQVAYKASSPSEEHVTQDSSESSSVDIDLNRPLSAVSSKPPELHKDEEVVHAEQLRPAAPARTVVTHHHRFPIEEIDLNLPPVDHDCNSPLLATEDDGGDVQLDLQTYCSNPVVMQHTFTAAASVEGASTSVLGTINLNEPLPTPEMMMMEEAGFDPTEQSGLGEQGHSASESVGVSSTWPVGVELVAFDTCSDEDACARPQLLHKTASCTVGFSSSCKCQSRKRSLDYQESEIAAQGVDNGKELMSFSRKRAMRCELPFRLDGVHTRNFIFSMHMDAVAKMTSWSRTGIRLAPRASDRRQDWNIRVSPSALPLHVSEKFVHNTELQLPKCKIVEVDGDTEAVNTETAIETQTKEGHAQKSVSTVTPLARHYGNVKRLRCHFSEAEAPVSSSYSRSKLRRLPRKFTISVDSRSGKSRLVKAKERYADWSWHQDGGKSSNVVESQSCSSNSHGSPTTDHEGDLEVSQQGRRVNPEVLDDELQHDKIHDCDPRRKPGSLGRPWETTSAAPGPKKNVREDMDRAKSLLRTWKVPCLTLTSPRDSCDSYELPRQMPRSRGIRSSGRSHSQGFPMKSTDSNFLNFDMGTKRSTVDQQEFEITKKIKVDASYSLRSHEMTEEDLLITLCSMQEQKLEPGVTSSKVSPKVKGKRSSRLRRRNFSFKQFNFDGHIEDVEEGLFVQPCTPQGPWQPTCHLPTIDKIPRSPKLRRRRSGLPCKSSCVAAATSPIVSGLKSSGSTSKGQTGSRLPGQTASAEEEATAPLNWPVHDVRFSLRRVLSDGAVKSDRQSGRKVPARWNQFPVC